MFFYALVAATLLFSRSFQIVLLISVLASLTALGAIFQPTEPIARVHTDPILLEFAGGIFVARAVQHGFVLSPIQGVTLAIFGLAILAAEQFFGVQASPWRTVDWGIPSTLILFGAISSEEILLKIAPLKYLGDASYATYLVHGSVINIVGHLPVFGQAQVLMSFLASIATGVIFHEGEFRLISWLRSRR
jgi:exopolysaccharide production protein ExoZ